MIEVVKARLPLEFKFHVPQSTGDPHQTFR